jgi:hypothetical protein
MLCPFHLEDVGFKQSLAEGRHAPTYQCPTCGEMVPILYVQDYGRYPPIVVSAIGFRGHGKTVYFAALFYALKKLRLSRHWSRFFTMSLDEDSLDTVYHNVEMLEGGVLPDSTLKNFPRPTVIRLEGVPNFQAHTLLCYDTSGEAFEKAREMVQYAGFVRQAKTAMLLLSVPDLDDPPTEMYKLLNNYVLGMGELGGSTRNQHLVVVYAKADELADRLTGQWDDLHTYLSQGSVDGLAHPEGYMGRMHRVSAQLREFTAKELGADEFLSATSACFRSVTFSMVSALGARPQGQRLPVEVAPRRVLDPLLWVMDRSLPGWKRVARSWFG